MIGGRISTGSYKDKDGKTIYTTDVVVEEHYFCESKAAGVGTHSPAPEQRHVDDDGFMNYPDDGELPF